MALSDYRLCDVCGWKAFYDSQLGYRMCEEIDESGPAFRIAGEPASWPVALDYVGDWAVLCHDCAKTHRTRIVMIEPKPEGRDV